MQGNKKHQVDFQQVKKEVENPEEELTQGGLSQLKNETPPLGDLNQEVASLIKMVDAQESQIKTQIDHFHHRLQSVERQQAKFQASQDRLGLDHEDDPLVLRITQKLNTLISTPSELHLE